MIEILALRCFNNVLWACNFVNYTREFVDNRYLWIKLGTLTPGERVRSKEEPEVGE